MKKFSELVINCRILFLLLIAVVTVFFGLFLKDIEIRTDFSQLLPQDHTYIKINEEFRKQFGGANFLVIMVSVKNGDIFNVDTLNKVKYITENLYTFPGIHRYKIVSIAALKTKVMRYTSWGINVEPLMWPLVPTTEKGLKQLKKDIFSSQLYGSYVSLDSKSTLIFADFFTDNPDYKKIHLLLEKLRGDVEDDNTIVSIAGLPMHLGVVRSLIQKVNYIMLATALVIPVLLFLAYRSFWATLLVPSAGIISGIWGLGFMALIKYNLDPLIFVMPFLISLMAFRHSHQLYNRFYEEYLHHGDKLRGARSVIDNMFLPGLTGVITDAFGIAIVTLVSIPLLRNIAIACAFWSVITVFVGLILTPILLSYMPVSDRFIKHIERERTKEQKRLGIANRFADWLGPWLITIRGRSTVILFVLFLSGFSYYWSEHLIVGDAQVGSNLLYPSSRYNQDSERINKNLPLLSPMYIIFDGKQEYALQENYEVLRDILHFSSYMTKHSGAVASENIITPITYMPKVLNLDDPKWIGLPTSKEDAQAYLYLILTSGNPGDMDRFVDPKKRLTNIVLYYKDKTGPTIQKAITTAREYVESVSKIPEGMDYKVAGGVIGVEAAINEEIAQKQLLTTIIALCGVFVFCAVNFRSFMAGLVLMLPLVLSNFMAFAYMAFNNIGLSISTLPVSAAGIGMGVDYGIYLLARLAEEKKKDTSITINDALIKTIQTYGKSIIYIAGTLVLGLLVWVLSPLKFQAQMGMMLAVILFLNCLGAVFLVPVLVLLFKPRFLK
ncbi:MAG: MMPL family transporter [Chitinispirillaceae bacterium]|nr:MMPL family transporter [Chitinispirillaceae bacterium]